MTAELRLDISEADADPERLEELVTGLRAELLELDVEQATRVPAGPAPEGTRGFDVAMVGALLVAVKPTVDGLTAVVGAVRSWLGRTKTTRAVRLEVDGDVLELSGASEEEQARLIEQWLSRHAADRA